MHQPAEELQILATLGSPGLAAQSIIEKEKKTMAISLRKAVVIRFTVPGFGQDAIFRFPSWGDSKMLDGIDRLLETRQLVQGRQVVDNSRKARCEFFDTFCLKAENLADEDEAGEDQDLMDFPDWKERIPASWKTSVVSQNFEERGTLDGEDIKN